MANELLRFTSKGIYCKEADIHIDPWRKVDKALITHGHADHARYGHNSYLAHHHTVEIMKKRLGEGNNYQGVEYGESVVLNGVRFTFIPAGHILGSSQIKVEYKGRVEVVTGDYKIEDDGISGTFEPIPCDRIITECTFGLPIYRWYPQQVIQDEMNKWVRDNAAEGYSSVLHGYSLGKAQRLQSMLQTDLPVFVHGAVHGMNEVYRACGIELPTTHRVGRENKPKSPCVVISPPAADAKWLQRFKPFRTAFASGWMMMRGPRRMRSMDKGFVLSDHLDWPGLQTMLDECRPEQVVCTHGYTEIYSQYLRERGVKVTSEKTEFEVEENE